MKRIEIMKIEKKNLKYQRRKNDKQGKIKGENNIKKIIYET